MGSCCTHPSMIDLFDQDKYGHYFERRKCTTSEGCTFRIAHIYVPEKSCGFTRDTYQPWTMSHYAKTIMPTKLRVYSEKHHPTSSILGSGAYNWRSWWSIHCCSTNNIVSDWWCNVWYQNDPSDFSWRVETNHEQHHSFVIPSILYWSHNWFQNRAFP